MLHLHAGPLQHIEAEGAGPMPGSELLLLNSLLPELSHEMAPAHSLESGIPSSERCDSLTQHTAYYSFNLQVEELEPHHTLRGDGYVDGTEEHDEPGHTFHNIPYFQHCPCSEEFRERSLQLVGELIFPDGDPAHAAMISIQQRWCVNGIRLLTFFASNTMTETTAFGLLHLLHHLRDTAYRTSTDGLFNSTINVTLNAQVLGLLSAGGVKSGGLLRFNCSLLSIFGNPTVARLEELGNQLRFNRVEACKNIRDLAGLDTSLQLCAGAGQTCKELAFEVEVEDGLYTTAVDSIIEVGWSNIFTATSPSKFMIPVFPTPLWRLLARGQSGQFRFLRTCGGHAASPVDLPHNG